MTSQLEGDVRLYCREVEILLVCKAKIRRSFIAEFQSDIQSFISEAGGNVSMEDVRKFFGPPENIANGFLESLSPKDVRRAINWKRTIVIGLGVILLALIIYAAISLIDGHLAAVGQGEEYLLVHG